MKKRPRWDPESFGATFGADLSGNAVWSGVEGGRVGAGLGFGGLGFAWFSFWAWGLGLQGLPFGVALGSEALGFRV